MTVPVLLIPICVFLLVVLFSRNTGANGILYSLVKAHLVLFAFVAVATEFLSFFSLIEFSGVLFSWLMFCFFCSVCVLYTGRWRHLLVLNGLSEGFDSWTFIAAGISAVILAAGFASALLYPPNNWDAMAYHMARVANWIANHSVSFFQTNIGRQNYQMPLAEFAIMQLQVLSGSDMFAGLVQWWSFLVSICLGALIASELGLGRKGRLISSVFVATIPMAIVQSSTAQNDLVVSSFIMSFAFFMLRLGKDSTVGNLVFASLGLGLSLLTKGTAYIYCFACGICLALAFLKRALSRSVVKSMYVLFFIVVMALLLNVGHYVRSYRVYGTPLSGGEEGYFNEDLSPCALLSNIPKNISLHLGTSSKQFNRYIYNGIRLITGTHIDNPDTTFPVPFFVVPYNRTDNAAGNPIHMFLILFSFASILFRKKDKYGIHVYCYATGVLLAGFLFCVCLKWQPWGSRLHTPFFVLAAPLIAIALSELSDPAGRLVALAIVLGVFFFSVPFAFDNHSKSLLAMEWRKHDRTSLYFSNRPALYGSYISAINIVHEKGEHEIGLCLGVNDAEYPFWALANTDFRALNIKFVHVVVEKISKILAPNGFLPDYVIATRGCAGWSSLDNYFVLYEDNNLKVLRKAGQGL